MRSDRPATWADARQITFDHARIEFLDLSPDGRTLAVSSDRSGNLNLWLMPAAGGEMRPITTDPTPDWAPRWSPDGTQITFHAYRTGNRDVWVLPLDGGPARQLTYNPGGDLLPRWSANGREIVFASGRSRPPGVSIWSVPANGGEEKLIDHLPSSLDAARPVWSLDGRWLALTVRRGGEGPRLWRAHVDGSSAEPVTAGPAAPRRSSLVARRAALFFIGAAGACGEPLGGLAQPSPQRPVTTLTGRLGHLMGTALATDGQRLFFGWEESIGDVGSST